MTVLVVKLPGVTQNRSLASVAFRWMTPQPAQTKLGERVGSGLLGPPQRGQPEPVCGSGLSRVLGAEAAGLNERFQREPVDPHHRLQVLVDDPVAVAFGDSFEVRLAGDELQVDRVKLV